MFFQFAKILLWLPVSIIHPTKIFGKKNLPKGKAVLISNHRSNWDIVLYLLHTRRKIKILAKVELFKNKLFGAILRNFGGIEIDRNANDIGAIKKCMKALKDDNHLYIFPEGTRSKDEYEILGEFKSGVAMIAIKTKTPIVPIWIERKPRIFRRSVYHIGKPFELTEFYGKKLDEEALQTANEVVRSKLLEHRQEVMQNNPRAKKRMEKNK